MRRGILIALLVVPALALAGPKKRPKKKKAAEPVEEKTEKAEPEPAPTPEPSGTPTVPPGTKLPGTAPAGSGSAAAKSGSAAPTTPATPPATAPATPGGPLTTKGGTTPTTPGTTPPGTTPAPQPEDPPTEPKKDVDVDALRQEYLALRDELFKSRARANAVASQLYSTRMTIKFTWGSARHYGVSKASIRVDGATVYENATGAIANDDGIRWSGYVAPGRHLVTFHVEAAGKDDDSFTSATESQVVVKAVANKDLLVSAKGKDNGDIAYSWKREQKGSYGLGIDVSVKTVAAGAKK